MNHLSKGDIWLGETPNHKPGPYLIMTRNEAIPVLTRVLAAPVTTTTRGIASEVPLGEAEGLRTACAASMDNLVTIRKSMLVRKLGALSPSRMGEACEALRAATDC